MKILFFNIQDNLVKIDNNAIDSKFASYKRNLEYTIGRFLIKLSAKRFYNLDNFQLDETQQKPRIIDNKFFFSISHSTEYVCIALGEAELGFDIEKIKEKNYTKIAKRMNFQCQNLEDFFRCWTEYEAQYKSNMNLVKSFKFKDYMCAISAEKINKIRLYNVTLRQNNFDFSSELFDNVLIEEID